MSTLGCWFAEITGRERHRASCPRCQARSQFDAEVRRIAGSVEPRPVDSAMLARAITAAAGAPQPPVWQRWLGVGLGLAAATTVAVVVLARGGGPQPGTDLASTTGPLAQGARITVGHAEVIATEGTLAMRTGDAEIWLGHGQVEVDVDPEPHRAFRVTTPRFSVRVLGTHFVVSDDGVRVDRGAVQIVDPTGHVVVPRLGAGERWLVAQWQASTETAAAPVNNNVIKINPSSTAQSGNQTAQSGGQTARSGGQTASSGTQTKHRPAHVATAEPKQPAATPAKDFRARFTELQDQIAKNVGIPAVRDELGQIAHNAPLRSDRARAESMVAETYLATRDFAEAQQRLADVASRYRDLGYGEAALFAASKAARNAGHAADERALLETYLERYPNGSLHIQARKRLDAVSKPH